MSQANLAQPRRHVLIVAINYAPEKSGTAPYTAAIAEHLAAAHDVTVLAGMPHYPAWRVPRRYRRLRVHEHRGAVHVIRCAHYVPARQSAVQRALYEGSFLVSALAGSVDVAKKPDAVLGVVPSLNGAILARMLGARYGVPYGVIFQDLMGQAAAQSGIVGGAAVSRLTAGLERWGVRRAAAVGIVAEAFRPYLERLGVAADRIVHLPNWSRVAPPAADRAVVRASLGWGDDETVVLHAGNMGLKQGLEQVIEAARAAAARPKRLRFAFVGSGSQRATLEAAARGLANVTFLGFVSDSEFGAVLRASDYLLVSERPSASNMSLPSKLTAYFAVGRPVIAAVPLNGSTAREVERSGAGVVIEAGDHEGLLDAVERLEADTSLRQSIATAGTAYVDSALSSELGLSRTEAFVRALLDRRAPAIGSRG